MLLGIAQTLSLASTTKLELALYAVSITDPGLYTQNFKAFGISSVLQGPRDQDAYFQVCKLKYLPKLLH